VTVAVALASCGSGDSPTARAEGGQSSAAAETTLRLGYFPNVTHAPALVGIHDGILARALGGSAALDAAPFNAGPEAVEALFAGAIDATFIGPNPAINAYARSGGDAVRIVAGTTSGGAFLVVSPDIASAEDLRGKTVASPQLGGTQDVALRSWLLSQGLETDTAQGGDVSIAPQANPDTLTAFQAGEIAGAWVPEPWATRLVQEGGGTVLVDERDLWPGGEYVTTHLLVATEFLEDHPDVVRGLVEGLVDTVDAIEADPAAAQASANAAIAAVTDKPLPQQVITAAWENLTFTVDPIASSLQKSADDAIAVGLLDPVDLAGIYDLTILDEVLAARGRDKVAGL
jgi:NitT/TauT family transport system substrate-binding protein